MTTAWDFAPATTSAALRNPKLPRRRWAARWATSLPSPAKASGSGPAQSPAYQLVHLDDGHQDGQDDEQHHDAHRNDDRRLEDAGEQAHAVLVLHLLVPRRLRQHVREAPARFARSHQMDEDPRKDLAAVARPVERAGLAHQA